MHFKKVFYSVFVLKSQFSQMYLLQRSKANLCKPAHFTGTVTDKIDTKLLFSQVFKVKWGRTDECQLAGGISS